MNNFQEMGLSPVLIQALDKLGFTQPTLIQEKAVPLALQHKDILGSAQTGTGKTLAFSLPLINQLLNSPVGMGLILAPTRELAQQVTVSIDQLLFQTPSIKTALLIGEGSYAKQLSQLRAKARIIIGTPGRIIDHLERGNLKVDAINFLVLDETDRMLDMGFSIQLEQIFSQLPIQRQTLMFSATFPPKIERLAAKYMQDAERIFVNGTGAVGIVAQNLTQEVLEVNEKDKYTALLTQLSNREGSMIVFVKTKSDAEHLAIRLGKEDYDACAIHGNLRQSKRERVMRAFRQGRHQIMVATDIAARGLDVPHVLHVINYDIPHAPEDYIHRVGRTARAGAKGFAMSFVSSQDRKKWNAIQELLNPEQCKAERETLRKQDSRNANSEYHPQGNNKRSSKTRSQGYGGSSPSNAPRQGKSSRSHSQGYEGSSPSNSPRQGRSSRSHSQGYEGPSPSNLPRQGRSSRPHSQGYEGASPSNLPRQGRYSRSHSKEYEGPSPSNSSRQGRFSRSHSKGYGEFSQSNLSRQDRFSKPRSQEYGEFFKSRSQEEYDLYSESRSQTYGIASQKSIQRSKFQKNFKNANQHAESKNSSNRNFSDKKLERRRDHNRKPNKW